MKSLEISQQLVDNLGGKENIRSYTHCATRLRFQVSDENKVNHQELEKIDQVLSVIKATGQIQVVFGPNIIDIYSAFKDLVGTIDHEVSDHNDNSAKKNILNRLIDLVSSIFTPIIYVLIGSGIIKGILSILTTLKLMSPTSGTYEIFNAAGDSLYYFLPMILAVTCARRFKTNIFVSITIGGALLYPNITALSRKVVKFMGIPIEIATFKSSVFPIIFAIFTLSYLERFLKKVIPAGVENIFEPLISIAIIVPLTILIFGPIGSYLSNALANLYIYLYNLNKIVAGAFIGFFAQLMVVFGVHWGLFPIGFSNLAKFGYDPMFAVFGPSIVAQSGAALGVLLRTKNPDLKKVATSATFMGFLGISEPAIYGITLKNVKIFVLSMVSGGIGGAIAGAAGSRATAAAVASIPSFPVYFGHGFKGFIFGYFAAFFIAAILVYSFGYDPNNKLFTDPNDKNPLVSSSSDNDKGIDRLITAPVTGVVKLLNDVNDKVFSSKALGPGVAIIPNAEKQVVLAPISGELTAIYPTKHAYGITTAQGEEYLIHIGINTVDLQGELFKSTVKKGQKINYKETLCQVDFLKMVNQGYDSSVIVTKVNAQPNEVARVLQLKHVNAGNLLAQIVDKRDLKDRIIKESN